MTGWQVTLLFYHLTLVDFSCCHWRMESVTLATHFSYLQLLSLLMATGQSNKFLLLVGQECDYTDSHWLESEEYKSEVSRRQLENSYWQLAVIQW